MRTSAFLAKDSLGEGLICAEIGVKDGENAQVMLDNMPLKKLYLIDPYKPYERCPDEVSVGTSLYTDDEKALEGFYNLMVVRLKPYKDFVEILKMTSEEASKVLKDVLFDYVYIDGNHNSDFVRKDIELWFPLVRKGGILAGHDAHFNNVIKPVTDFFSQNQEEIDFKVDGFDWIFKKHP